MNGDLSLCARLGVLGVGLAIALGLIIVDRHANQHPDPAPPAAGDALVFSAGGNLQGASAWYRDRDGVSSHLAIGTVITVHGLTGAAIAVTGLDPTCMITLNGRQLIASPADEFGRAGEVQTVVCAWNKRG